MLEPNRAFSSSAVKQRPAALPAASDPTALPVDDGVFLTPGPRAVRAEVGAPERFRRRGLATGAVPQQLLLGRSTAGCEG